MSIIIELPPNLERELERKAERRGIAASDYVCELVVQQLSGGHNETHGNGTAEEDRARKFPAVRR